MDHILVTHPHRYYDNGILERSLEQYEDHFDGQWYALQKGDMAVEPDTAFYDDVIEDLEGNGRVDPTDLPAEGKRYVAGGIGQKCLYRTIDSLDRVDGLVPELTYVEAVPVSADETTLVRYDEQKLHRFGGPLGTDMREIQRLDRVDDPEITLFESAPFTDAPEIVRLASDDPDI